MHILKDMRISSSTYYILLIASILLSCTTQRSSSPYTLIEEDSNLSRPNPGYVQYVKNRSMLSESSSLLSTVSSSIYSFSTERPSAQTLRSMASVWLYINPALYITDIGSSFLKSLEYANLLEMLSNTGIQGLYTRPLFGTSYLWTNGNKMLAYNEDAVQFEIATDVGSLQEFTELRTTIGEHAMFFGTSLLPIATGMGADFWLATRDVEEYKGLYGLISIPKNLWKELPYVEQTHVLPLSSHSTDLLIENNILPQRFIQDSLQYFPQRGWAITSEITDIHGESQRYAYRYYRIPELPMFHLYNPTLQATRILNASVVQSIGIYGSALVGFSLMPYYGLINQNQLQYFDTFYIELTGYIERMIQRYGAFAFLQDSLPIPVVAKIFAENDAVFIEDSITSPYAEYALLSQNTGLLKEMMHYALSNNIPIERLVHTTIHEKGIPLYPIALYTTDQKNYISSSIETKHTHFLSLIQKLSTSYPFMTHTSIPYNNPTLATLSLGYPLHENIQYHEAQYNNVLKAHKALLFFKAMLPGILMISAQDLTAPLPMKQSEYERTGNLWKEELASYSGYTLQVLPYSTLINRFSIPLAKTLYPEFPTQDIAEYSLKKELTQILKLRSELSIANTSLIEVLPTNDGIIALILKNKANELYVAITNFTNNKQSLSLQSSIPDVAQKLQQQPIRSYPSTYIKNNRLHLPPFGCVLLHIQ